ncbi:hypothetical protein LIER_43754 [Lithospermum erythrorhizon]|uniref:Neprosin PEP catalytic domain-containing protein n=1 Tax=Lithospermum erythrorhizon TaxID=34254 RepID=A0AAV3QQG6_LITER
MELLNDMECLGDKKHGTSTRCHFDQERRQSQCRKQQEKQTVFLVQTRHKDSSIMDFSCRCKIFSIVRGFVWLLFLLFSVCPVQSLDKNKINQENQTNTFKPSEATQHQNLKMIRAHLMKINKPAIKTIKSPDGDIIDCVLSHQQPAFDHPELKGKKPLDPPERPSGQSSSSETTEDFQLWSMSGESCPEGTVPIRRSTEEDILRASSISTFGRKIIKRPVRRDSSSNGHEHAVGYVSGNTFYGGKASINVWAPRVENQYEFSLSQIWVISGSFGGDLNTIEAGWQVCISTIISN